MAVTGLDCNPPLWRFHRGPDPLPSPCAPILNPEALRVPFSGDLNHSLTNRSRRGRIGWRRQSVCLCHSRVSSSIPRLLVTRCCARWRPPLGTIVAAPTRWVVVSVEARSEWNRQRTPPCGRKHIVGPRKERPRRTVPRTRPWKRAVAKAGMQWPVVWTPRAAAAWPERRREAGRGGGGGETGRTTAFGFTGRQVRLGLFKSAGPDTVPVPVKYGYGGRAPAILVPPRARHSVAIQSIT